MPTPISLIESKGANVEGGTTLFAGVVGFFFVFRVCLTFLFFQASPVTGTIVSITTDIALLYGAVLYSVGKRKRIEDSVVRTPTIRWIFALLTLSAISMVWTGAESEIAALAYWTSMAADVAIVLLLMQCRDSMGCALGMMKGAVWGAGLLSIIAWLSPATADLRLGNDAFLHPNTLGLEIGIATLIAQYLASQGAGWRWLCIGLAMTLLRTLSKTAIIAFLIAECWYLMQAREMERRTKLWVGVAALVVAACFWGLLSAYLDIYNNTGSGNQAETLTGRTLLWAAALSMGMEKPWLGHGFYSFKTLIPSFGSFEPVHAHNELLQQFFEYGIAGVVIAAGVYWSFYRQVCRVQPNALRTLALALLLFALVRGLTDTVPFGLSYPLWLLAMLTICLRSGTAEAFVS